MVNLIFFVFFMLNAFAIEHLPCQRLLSGSTFKMPNGKFETLESDEVLVRGSLLSLWGESGMEDQTAWSIVDDQINTKLSGDGYDALFRLRPGDRVYLLNPNGFLRVEGEHDEINSPGTVQWRDQSFEVNPNFPRLLMGNSSVIGSNEYRVLFENNASAVAKIRIDQVELKRRDRIIKLKLALYEAHQSDQKRFVAIGSGQLHERQIFESVCEGLLIQGEQSNQKI